MDILEKIAESLKQGDASMVSSLVQEGLDKGLNWEIILEKGLFKGMEVVGTLFRENEMFIPEVIMSAKAMEAGIKLLNPFMLTSSVDKKRVKVVLGTVKGDIHNIGKDLVGMMLKGAGFEVIDIGINVPAETFVDTAISEKAQLVGMSALLTTTMPQMQATIAALNKAGLSKQVKTIIGGACVSQEYANEIGADGYAENAAAAVGKAIDLLKSK